ncbi:MAG: class I SAM-dependent methyltransferase [Alphaproteobacteria bacterium]|nr:class I SAM-dependent methyltransferase [Alphaproteobacteria bacterium]
MADLLGMDPGRIGRLRSPERLEYFDPAEIWDVLQPGPDCTLIDIGAGVGFLTLPFAKAYPGAKAYGCDILEGMVRLLVEDAAAQGLDNVEAILMQPAAVPLPGDCADVIVMAQLHHELDAPEPLMAECRRLLAPGGTVAIVDWKDEENGRSPAKGRRVPEATIRAHLAGAGFTDIDSHDVYEFHGFVTGRA